MTQPDRCTSCQHGHYVAYKSRRSADGLWQTQYLACWLCRAIPDPCKRVVPAKPRQIRCTRLVHTHPVLTSPDGDQTPQFSAGESNDDRPSQC